MSVLDWFKKRERVVTVHDDYVIAPDDVSVRITRRYPEPDITDVGAHVPTSHNRIVVYANTPTLTFGNTCTPWMPQEDCTTCDVVDVTALGDAYRRFQCVHCGRESVTSEPNAATGKTTRLSVITCAACDTETPADGAYCIGCGAGRLR